MSSSTPSSEIPPGHRFFLFFLVLLAVVAIGCSSNKRVVVLVDGERRVIETQATNVGEVLKQQNIVLGEQDRVEPPDYTPIERTATIQIVRVALRTETTREPVEFGRNYSREENLPEGQVRVSRLGANGEAEIDYQVTLEDGREVSRREIARRVLTEPVNELLLIGTQGTVAAVNITGTLAYIGKGNAWIVRGTTADRRPLTTDGDLDGRVFDLTPDGKYLLYSRGTIETDPASPKINSLWVVDTVPFNAEPRRVPIENALYAQWAPDGSGLVAYTSGERTQGAPGWKAYNDLRIATLHNVTETMQVTDTDIQTQTVLITPTPLPSDTPPPTATVDPLVTPDPAVPTLLPLPTYTPRPFGRAITRTIYITSTSVTTISQTAKTPITVTEQIAVPKSAPAPLSWWGWNFQWAPDGKTFAYGLSNQIGLVTPPFDCARQGQPCPAQPFDCTQQQPPCSAQGEVTAQLQPMENFAYYNTRGDWVWVPQLTWSPDGQFVAATVHAPPNGAEKPEDATTFDVWLLARDGQFALPLARNTGMWAFPAWSPRDARGESKIAFGEAQNQVNSERSLYSLYIMDRDGSNRERIFPQIENALEGVRVVQFAWSPDVKQVIALREGDLWLYDLASKQWAPLTANGDSKLARWR